MSCLTHEQMLLEAFGLEGDATARLHLKTCSTCREQVEVFRQLPERFSDRLSSDEQKAISVKERLLAALPEQTESSVTEPRMDTALTRFQKTRLGDFVMKHRFACGGTALVSMALLLVWASLWTSPLSAMEETAEAIRKAKSYQCDTVMVVSREGIGEFEVKGKMYQQGSRRRMEMFDKGKLVSVNLVSTTQSGMSIDHRRKSYSHNRPMRGKGAQSPINSLHALGKFSGEADEDLGMQQIGKIKARGFRIGLEKVDPDIGGGTLTVWVAPDTKLPVLVEIEMELLGGTMRMVNIQWNVDLKKELFEVNPPAGYTESSRPEPTLEEQVEKITLALKNYADAFEGNYPQARIIYGDVTPERLAKKLGIPEDPREAFKHNNYKRYSESRNGFTAISMIQRENPDAEYFGKTVGPTDEDKVLFYWKLLDGSYSVIYGDLNSETVTEAKLLSMVKKK